MFELLWTEIFKEDPCWFRMVLTEEHLYKQLLKKVWELQNVLWRRHVVLLILVLQTSRYTFQNIKQSLRHTCNTVWWYDITKTRNFPFKRNIFYTFFIRFQLSWHRNGFICTHDEFIERFYLNVFVIKQVISIFIW